jgi:hypothetical protein
MPDASRMTDRRKRLAGLTVPRQDSGQQSPTQPSTVTIPNRGSRIIRVDGSEYRWRIRRKPTYSQIVFQGTLTIAVECTEPGSSCVLLIDAGTTRPDACIDPSDMSITPGMIAEWIRQALQSGWIPTQAGPAFKLERAEPQ